MNGGRGRVGMHALVAPFACAVGLSLGLGLGFGLAACTPQTAPTPTPSVVTSPRPTTTPSPAPTPTPTPDAAVKPERPAAMDEVSAAGAEAAAVYFLQLYPYVYATGDLDEWRELSHPECVFCASVISNVEEQVAAGEHSVGGLVDISTVTSTEVDPARWFSVHLEATQDGWAVYDSIGQVIEEATTARDHTFGIALVQQDGAWLVRAVQVDDAPA